MSEKQNIEYKQSWHDVYLKWVCGFANAIGGIIYIGIDDKGNVTHLTDYEKLMEEYIMIDFPCGTKEVCLLV